MNKWMSVLAFVCFGTPVFASTTYVCETDKKNHTKVQANDSIMVLSNTEVQYGSKTIATFKDEDETLSVSGKTTGSSGKTFVGKVDLRRNGMDVGGKYLLGTRLSEVKEIEVTVWEDEDGSVSGSIEASKRNGEKLWASFESCAKK